MLRWSLVLLWLMVIFAFSAQTADQSSTTSGSTIRLLLNLFYPPYGDLTAPAQAALVAALSHLVRKLAHGLVFSLLGLLLMGATLTDFPPRKALLLALLLGYVAAGLDEMHQILVPGRSGELLDLLIDFGGICFGTGIRLLLHALKERRQKKKQARHEPVTVPSTNP